MTDEETNSENLPQVGFSIELIKQSIPIETEETSKEQEGEDKPTVKTKDIIRAAVRIHAVYFKDIMPVMRYLDQRGYSILEVGEKGVTALRKIDFGDEGLIEGGVDADSPQSEKNKAFMVAVEQITNDQKAIYALEK
jgi:hypothetical protein